MRSTLHIEGRALLNCAAGLWRLLLDHTGCERATADLLVQLTAARLSGPIEYCLVFEEPTERREGEPRDRASWRLQVVRPGGRADRVVLSVRVEHLSSWRRGNGPGRRQAMIADDR
jgi:hypothetical protein